MASAVKSRISSKKNTKLSVKTPFEAELSRDVTPQNDVASLMLSPENLTPLTPFTPNMDAQGDSASNAALMALNVLTKSLKDQDIALLFSDAVKCLSEARWKEAGDIALKILYIDERSSSAWHVLGISRDKCNDYFNSLNCYEKALLLDPENILIGKDLGRLAYRMGNMAIAIKIFELLLARDPYDTETLNNLCSALRETNQLDLAIDLLKTGLKDNPQSDLLWNTLATILNVKGDLATAVIFYDEAVRLNPKNYQAIHNRALARHVLGDLDMAIKDFKLAKTKFNDDYNRFNSKIAYAHALLANGDLKAGWHAYLAQDREGGNIKLHTLIDRPKWNGKTSLNGKHVFVIGEQGLGDEIMFSGQIPDILEAVGPTGHVTLSCEARLVPIFQKAFPQCDITPHYNGEKEGKIFRFFPQLKPDHTIDEWALICDFLSQFRSQISDFEKKAPHLKPDPQRVAFWQDQLRALGPQPKIGLLWKSMIAHSQRNRNYSPFDNWSSILDIKDLIFINLQYGDCSQELAEAKAMGYSIWTPPDIDLKNDLDDLSALCLAVDLVLGPSNATTNLAAATGVPVWFMTLPHSWNCFNLDHNPWYPNTRLFITPSLMDWRPAFIDMKQALLSEIVGTHSKSEA